MAAKAQPVGSVTEKFGKDVKPAEESSPSETKETAPPPKEEPQDEVSGTETDLTEADLQDFQEESRKIPYGRFKEVNQKAKELEAQVKEQQDRFQDQLRREVELAELRIKSQLQRERELALEDESLDPTDRKLKFFEKELRDLREENKTLRSETNSKLLQDQVTRLERVYDKRVVLAALGLKKHDPKIDLEEACQEFETAADERANRQLKQIIEKKKLKARQAIPTRDGGIKLKDSERPKTLAEAKAAAKRFFG